MKLCLLDRDGVINVDRPNSVRSIEEFSLLPKVTSAIRLLNEAHIPVAVVTNQAVVGRGDLSLEGLFQIHDHMAALLKKDGAYVDHIFMCTSPDPNDPRRKPNPGLLLDALKMFHVKHSEAVFIGDDLRDLEAASAINCHKILVKTGKGQKVLDSGLPEKVMPVTVFSDLYEAVSHSLRDGL